MDVIMEVRTPSLMDLLELSSHERIILSLANPELEPEARDSNPRPQGEKRGRFLCAKSFACWDVRHWQNVNMCLAKENHP